MPETPMNRRLAPAPALDANRHPWQMIANWCNDPETTRYMATGRQWVTAEDAAVLWGGKNSFLVIVGEEPWVEETVGIVGLYDQDGLSEKAELRILLGARRGGGLGTWATQAIVDYGFQHLGLWRIYLGTARDNEAAVRAFRRAGFVDEGILVDDLKREGKRFTNLRMAILRTDWEAAHVQRME